MRAVLIAWVGVSDLKGPEKAGTGDLGPIAQALAARSFDQVVLLEFFDKADHQKLLPGYIAWLRERTPAEIVERRETLRGPTDFGGIYEAARRACQEVLAQHRDATLTFHLSPGSPPMAAVWMLLGKTIFPAQLIESSREQGVSSGSRPSTAPSLWPSGPSGRWPTPGRGPSSGRRGRDFWRSRRSTSERRTPPRCGRCRPPRHPEPS